jgi:plastocyanin
MNPIASARWGAEATYAVRAVLKRLAPWLLLPACFDLGVGPPSGQADAIVAADLGGIGLDAAPSDGERTDAAPADAAPPCVEEQVDPAQGGTPVVINNNDLTPRDLRIPSGTVVIWQNRDQRSHRMVAGTPNAPIPVDQGGFDTGSLSTDDDYGWRFCAPRMLVYYCSRHPSMMRDYTLTVE